VLNSAELLPNISDNHHKLSNILGYTINIGQDSCISELAVAALCCNLEWKGTSEVIQILKPIGLTVSMYYVQMNLVVLGD
jgi:hypothetical protein